MQRWNVKIFTNSHVISSHQKKSKGNHPTRWEKEKRTRLGRAVRCKEYVMSADGQAEMEMRLGDRWHYELFILSRK